MRKKKELKKQIKKLEKEKSKVETKLREARSELFRKETKNDFGRNYSSCGGGSYGSCG